MARFTSLCLSFALFLLLAAAGGMAQSPRDDQKRNPRQTPKPTSSPAPADDRNPEDKQGDIETIAINTDLVILPVIATDVNGLYVADLRREEFSLEEDGVKQEIAFFATVSAPFHVILMLDTSASTKEKLTAIQNAAYVFTQQLQRGDQVKVISFDDEIRDLNEFTSDREVVKAAINKTRSGQGTRLYDALEVALSTVRRIPGRKAIVLFTDGVDFGSDRASLDSTLRGLDEEGVIVYPIRYNTRAETEQLARQQAEQISPPLPTRDVIRRPPGGTTAPTFPGEGPDTVPTSGTRPRTGPLGLPLPGEIMRRRREAERERDRMPSPDGLPPTTDPSRAPRPGTYPPSDRDDEDGRTYPPTDPRSDPGARRPDPAGDSISKTLDFLYLTADGYLKTLAEKSGGRLLRADTLQHLPDAFAKIAAELRTQYTLGYYPVNKARDDRYRRIKVRTQRPGAIIRTRPGYQVRGDK